MAVGKDTLWTDTVVADSAKSLTDSHVEHEPATTAGSHVISDEVVGSFECPFTRDFDTLVQNTLDQWHIQGMSIAVVHGDKTWTKGYGHSILPDEPVQPTTLFYTGSTTKSFLAAAVSTLVHDNDKFGEIQWDTPLNQLIRDDFVLQDHYATSHVTIEDALSHRTGMPGHTLTFGGSTLKESVRSLRHLYMNKPIRTTWQYCNLMYMAVSHMVEVVTGSWLGDFMKKRIWEPLGMKQTFFKLADAEEYVRQHHPECQIAVGYSWDKTNEVAKAVPCWRDMVVSGAGAIISSAEDYAKYLRMMIEQPQDGPLPNQSYTDVTSPRTIMPPFDPHYSQTLLYALGWIIGVYNGETVVSHGGGLEGFSTGMLYLPARKFGVAILANTQSRGTEVPAWHLIDNLLNVPLEKRVDMFEWNENAEAENKKQIASAPARLYPSVPSPGLSLTLPLSAYTGTYTNDAYRPFVISLTDEPDAKLRAVTEGPVQVVLSLVHVTGEHFVANMFLFTHATEPLAALKAQFKIGIQGKVSEFGAELDFLSGGGAMIWFKRIEE